MPHLTPFALGSAAAAANNGAAEASEHTLAAATFLGAVTSAAVSDTGSGASELLCCDVDSTKLAYAGSDSRSPECVPEVTVPPLVNQT